MLLPIILMFTIANSTPQPNNYWLHAEEVTYWYSDCSSSGYADYFDDENVTWNTFPFVTENYTYLRFRLLANSPTQWVLQLHEVQVITNVYIGNYYDFDNEGNYLIAHSYTTPSFEYNYDNTDIDDLYDLRISNNVYNDDGSGVIETRIYSISDNNLNYNDTYYPQIGLISNPSVTLNTTHEFNAVNVRSQIEEHLSIIFNYQYQQGYYDGQSVGYQDGLRVGHTEGYTQGYEDGSSQDEVATSIFVGIVNVALLPINMFLAMLNFEVFGINIGGFVSALLTVAIVVIIIRIVVSGGNKSD